MKHEILHLISQFLGNLKFVFTSSQGEFVFAIISDCYYKKDCNILKAILVQDFCPSKTEITRFTIGFRLNF